MAQAQAQARWPVRDRLDEKKTYPRLDLTSCPHLPCPSSLPSSSPSSQSPSFPDLSLVSISLVSISLLPRSLPHLDLPPSPIALSPLISLYIPDLPLSISLPLPISPPILLPTTISLSIPNLQIVSISHVSISLFPRSLSFLHLPRLDLPPSPISLSSRSPSFPDRSLSSDLPLHP